jgi:hypothetical protein
MWLFSDALEDLEDDTVMEQHGADVLYSAMKSLMYATCTEDEEAQQDVVHRMIQISKPYTIMRWSESKIANGKPQVQMPKENAHLVHLEWTENEHAKLKAMEEGYTSCGSSGTWRVHRW